MGSTVTTGVLLTGFGGPSSLDGVAPFMRSLMGREPSAELVERVRRNYLTIGGASPLNGIAADMARKLEERLSTLGSPCPVLVGMRYAPPFIDDALEELKRRGCERVVMVSLSAFESKVAQGAYREAVQAAADRLGGLEIVEAPLAGGLEEYADFFAMSTASALTDLEPNEGAVVVFTAHSLPVTDLVEDDPYLGGLQRVASAVARELGMAEGEYGRKDPLLPGMSTFGSLEKPRPWIIAFQSKGARPCEWLGPDLSDVIDALAASPANAVVVVPIGFLTDHMETLFDLDVVAAGRALSAGLEFARAAVPNDHDDVMEALATSIVATL